MDQTLQDRLSFLMGADETVLGEVLEPTDLGAEAKNWNLQFTGGDYWEEEGAGKTHT